MRLYSAVVGVQPQDLIKDEGVEMRPTLSRPSRWRAVLILGATTVALFFIGFPAAFNHFELYNDEGLYLVQLREALARAGPYTHVYTAYGPAYNLFIAAIATLTRVPLDHDGNRLIALALWVAAATAAAVFVWRETRSLTLMVLTAFTAFMWIAILANDPGQPATFGFLLTIALLYITQRREPWSRWNAALIGALCMALVLVKINLGIYAIAAVMFSIVATAQCRQWLRLLVLIAAAAVPLAVLYRGLAHHDIEAFLFLFIVELGVASLIFRTYSGHKRLSVGWPALVGGGVAASVLVLLGAIFQGDGVGAVGRAVLFHSFYYLSSGGKFIQCVFVGYCGPVRMAGPWLASLIAFSGMAVVVSRQWTLLRILLRAAVLLTVFLPLLYPNSLNGLLSPMMAWAVVPILLIGDGKPRSTPSTSRICLAAMIVFGELQAYPIAGYHVASSSFLSVAAVFVVMRDLIDDLTALSGGGRWASYARVLPLLVAVVLTAAVVIQPTVNQWSTYSENTSLRLVGSHLMRLPPRQVASLESTVRNVKSRSCTSLVTFPGMLSFYVWTGLPAPHGLVMADSTNWQRPQNRPSTMKYLTQAHNTCLISNGEDLQLDDGLGAIPSWPWLTEYLTSRFGESANTGGDYVVSQSPR